MMPNKIIYVRDIDDVRLQIGAPEMLCSSWFEADVGGFPVSSVAMNTDYRSG